MKRSWGIERNGWRGKFEKKRLSLGSFKGTVREKSTGEEKNRVFCVRKEKKKCPHRVTFGEGACPRGKPKGGGDEPKR